jgi:hypothetical protein
MTLETLLAAPSSPSPSSITDESSGGQNAQTNSDDGHQDHENVYLFAERRQVKYRLIMIKSLISDKKRKKQVSIFRQRQLDNWDVSAQHTKASVPSYISAKKPNETSPAVHGNIKARRIDVGTPKFDEYHLASSNSSIGRDVVGEGQILPALDVTRSTDGGSVASTPSVNEVGKEGYPTLLLHNAVDDEPISCMMYEVEVESEFCSCSCSLVRGSFLFDVNDDVFLPANTSGNTVERVKNTSFLLVSIFRMKKKAKMLLFAVAVCVSAIILKTCEFAFMFHDNSTEAKNVCVKPAPNV